MNLSNKYELKPCPFCGDTAIFHTTGNKTSHTDNGFDFTIKCRSCGCRLPKNYSVSFQLGCDGVIYAKTGKTDERQLAVDDWNKRYNDNEESTKGG